jgi:hypothetical protein
MERELFNEKNSQLPVHREPTYESAEFALGPLLGNERKRHQFIDYRVPPHSVCSDAMKISDYSYTGDLIIAPFFEI